MTKSAKSYKYNCRDCPAQQRCINSKNLSPGIKSATIQRFKNRTDTFQTWDVLQQDCLLLREENRKAWPETVPQTGLLKRLKQAQQATNAHALARLEPLATQATPAPAISAPAPSALVPQADLCGITVIATERIMRLPDRGEVVLGRFERGFSNLPDVDLTFEDGLIPSISRRHALVMGRNGEHWLEDIGSTNGTYLNGRKLDLGESVQLEPGNRILLGRCRLMYVPFPQWALEPDSNIAHTPYLFVTHTGQHIELPKQKDVILGRSDPTLGYNPDLDMSVAGDISMHVSRRHARITERNGYHYLEEMGSPGGTRLNGRPIHLGDPPKLLHPGDQLWLGGCVVAYEWQLL